MITIKITYLFIGEFINDITFVLDILKLLTAIPGILFNETTRYWGRGFYINFNVNSIKSFSC